jgi:hypothetical protein
MRLFSNSESRVEELKKHREKSHILIKEISLHDGIGIEMI